MHSLYSTILPPSAIHHSLFLPHLTPSTIYPLPRSHNAQQGPDIKVVGNLVVAGGQDLRVFEIRHEAVPVQDDRAQPDEPMLQDGDMGDSFFDAAPADVSLDHMHCVPYSYRVLHITESTRSIRDNRAASTGHGAPTSRKGDWARWSAYHRQHNRRPGSVAGVV